MPELQPPTPEQAEQYNRIAHAIQSGVAMELAHDPSSGNPKHLRVGVNLRAVEHSALVRLLIANGIITSAQFYESLLASMQEELGRYEARLSDQHGAPVHLV